MNQTLLPTTPAPRAATVPLAAASHMVGVFAQVLVASTQTIALPTSAAAADAGLHNPTAQAGEIQATPSPFDLAAQTTLAATAPQNGLATKPAIAEIASPSSASAKIEPGTPGKRTRDHQLETPQVGLAPIIQTQPQPVPPFTAPPPQPVAAAGWVPAPTQPAPTAILSRTSPSPMSGVRNVTAPAVVAQAATNQAPSNLATTTQPIPTAPGTLAQQETGAASPPPSKTRPGQIAAARAAPLTDNSHAVVSLAPAPASPQDVSRVGAIASSVSVRTQSATDKPAPGPIRITAAAALATDPASISHPGQSATGLGNAVATPADSGHKDTHGHSDALLEPRSMAAEPAPQAATDSINPALPQALAAPSGDATAQVAHALTETFSNIGAAANADKITSAPAELAASNTLYAVATRVPVSLTVRLTPKELGTVSIQIERPAGAPATVTLTAERPETLALLQRDSTQLNQALDRAGVAPEGRMVMFHLSSPAEAAQAPASQPPPTFTPSHAGTQFDASSSGFNGASSWQQPSSNSQQPQGQPSRSTARLNNDPEPLPPNAAVAAARTLSDRINITA